MIKESSLRESNPWWKSAKNIDNDIKIREWENSKIKYDPRMRHMIKFYEDNDVVYTIRGPRQVGKTTLIKLQIREFIKRVGISPHNIFYYALDLAESKQDVVDAVEKYLKMTSRQRKNKRNYIFLDEASSIENWQKGIKSLADIGKLKNCTVLATGSQALNIKKESERLPGRKGLTSEAHDKILLPMKFAEFVEIMDPEIKKLSRDLQLLPSIQRRKVFNRLVNLQIDDTLEKLHNYQNELNELLHEYLLTGGTPKIVDEKIKNGFIDEPLYADYLDGFLGDWSLEGKDPTLLKQMIGEIIKSVGSLSSWNNISRDADIGSTHTVIDYVHTLQRLFAITVFFRYGHDKKIPMIKDQKKIHFVDPFYFHLFRGWLSTKNSFELSEQFLEDNKNESQLVEGVIGDHLIRWAFAISKKKQTFEPVSHVFYWRNDKKKEVDFILYDGDKLQLPLEVKFQEKVYGKKLAGFYSFLDTTKQKSGIVITKDELDVEKEYVKIPASLFLMLI